LPPLGLTTVYGRTKMAPPNLQSCRGCETVSQLPHLQAAGLDAIQNHRCERHFAADKVNAASFPNGEWKATSSAAWATEILPSRARAPRVELEEARRVP
jgi:hypothetical protein